MFNEGYTMGSIRVMTSIVSPPEVTGRCRNLGGLVGMVPLVR